jgi:hypothetical protein
MTAIIPMIHHHFLSQEVNLEEGSGDSLIFMSNCLSVPEFC